MRTYLIDGVDLSQWTILRGTQYRTNVATDRAVVELPTRHGVSPVGLPKFSTASLILTLAPMGDDLDEQMDQMAALVSLPSVTIARVTEAGRTTATAHMVSHEWEPDGWRDKTYATTTITFDLPGVFWRDPSPVTIEVPVGASTPTELGGTAPITDAIVQWPAQAGQLTLTDETTGTSIVIDSDGSTPATVDLGSLRAWGAATWTPSGASLDARLSYAPAGLLQVWPVQTADSRAPRLRASHACTVRARRAWL